MNENALKERIKYLSQAEGRTFNEIWRELILERFLVRISRSEYYEKFIFKGGLLLSHYINIGRETKDADFLVTLITADQPHIEKAFKEICSVHIEDGFHFSFSHITPLEQPHMNYPGFRLNLDLKFGEKMKDKIQIDIGVGDVVDPKTENLELYQYKGKPIFEGSVTLKVYPIETIFAEKLETLISKGAANSRMKDFHDLILLTREEKLLNLSKLQTNLIETFNHRKTNLVLPISFDRDDLIKMQQLWLAHRRGLNEIADELNLPIEISELITQINNWLRLYLPSLFNSAKP